MPVSPALLVADSAFPAELLPTLLEVSLTAVLLLRPVYASTDRALLDFTVDYLNPAGQRLLKQANSRGGTIRQLFAHLPTRDVLAFCQHVLETSEAGRYEATYQREGLDHYFQAAAKRWGSQLVVSFTDTADHEHSPLEEALRQSQARERDTLADARNQRQRLLALVVQAPALVARFTGPTHVIDLANDLFRWVFGYRPLLGKPYREAVPELEGQPLFDCLDQVYRTGDLFQATELRVQLDPLGSGQRAPFYFNLICQATRDATGQLSGVLLIATEVTQLVLARQRVVLLNKELAATVKQLRLSNAALERQVADRTHALLVTLKQLQKRQRELTRALATEQELGELKSRFVSLASHEFRTPLTTVLSSADLIADYPSSDQQPQRLKHVQQIRASVQHLSDLLEEYLSLGRLEAGKVAVQPTTLDLATFLRETIASLQGLCKADQLITQQVQCPSPIQLDASLLRKILLNLLSNALKYSGEGAVVRVHATGTHNQLTLRVQDEGIGIAPADQPHLFEQFFRARNVADIPGTGLGLYIIARYLDLLGGTSTLHSEPGVGTTVTLTIPYANCTAD